MGGYRRASVSETEVKEEGDNGRLPSPRAGAGRREGAIVGTTGMLKWKMNETVEFGVSVFSSTYARKRKRRL